MTKIREATPDDLERICTLISRSFTPQVSEKMNASLRDEEKKKNTTCFVAVDGSSIIGHAAVTLQRANIANLHSFAVAPERQHHRIGQALVYAGSTYLEKSHFEGIAIAHCVTHHLGSQKIFYTGGFSPINIELGKEIDHGIGQSETFVGFARVYSHSDPTSPLLYLPLKYQRFVRQALAPFCSSSFAETEKIEIGERLQEFLRNTDSSEKRYALRLYQKEAPAEMNYLLSQRYHIIGVYPLLEEGEIRPRLHMAPLPTENFVHDKICVLQPTQHIFDFVWGQYARMRK